MLTCLAYIEMIKLLHIYCPRNRFFKILTETEKSTSLKKIHPRYEIERTILSLLNLQHILVTF